MADPLHLSRLTTDELAHLRKDRQLIALLPVGSVEPHGPHLPLLTDSLISETAALRAAPRLSNASKIALIAPTIPYGVTNYAAGFPGAISVSDAALTGFVRSVVDALLRDGFQHVCVVNNHLEPEHDQAIRAALDGLPAGHASVACPLTRRWARTLSAEFKSGACHAGRYESSLVLAADPSLVRNDLAVQLPPLDISLSTGIREGKKTFADMGLSKAYTGAPAAATAREGDELYQRLADMVVAEVEEAMAKDPKLAREPG